MARYVIDGAASRVLVRARSSIHDTDTRWTALSGTIEADVADLTTATADVLVDMTRHDAGDFLRNRKLRKDLAVERYPEARYRLSGLRDITSRTPSSFTASADGTISWHSRDVTVTAAGEATFEERQLRATARFELDVRAFGVEPPRFLMFKVEDIVAVEVSLLARRT
jgi:polyisoprenoid-binding protein YceI